MFGDFSGDVSKPLDGHSWPLARVVSHWSCSRTDGQVVVGKPS